MTRATRVAAAPRAGGRRRPVAVDPDAFNTDDYVFEHGGQEYTLPSFASLKSGLIRSIRNMDEADAFYTVLETIADEETLAATDDMGMAELTRVMRGWQQAAQVSLGESSGSSRSSMSTPRRSRTTGGTASA
jgi:hypothetical protein